MWFGFSGPRIFGIRPYVGFTPQDFAGQNRPRGAAPPVPGFVYVIQGDHGRCKIGITTIPAARIASLRTASAFPLSFAFIGAVQNSAFKIEQEAQRLLAGNRVGGEWFDTSPEMAIAAVWGAAAKLGDKVQGLSEVGAARVVAVVASDGSPRKTVAEVFAGLTMLTLKITVLFIFCVVVYILFQAV